MDHFSPRAELRAATAAWHERVDALYGAMTLADPADYGRFLAGHARVYLPAEADLTAQGAERVFPGWEEGCRATLLRDDMRRLGLAEPEPERARITFAGAAELLGGIYVLEGSRLGGTVIARGLPEGLPRAFLTAHQRGRWRRLIQIIDARLDDPDQLARAIDSARQLFERFQTSGEQMLKAA